MSQLSICLFGPPTLTLDGRQVLLDRWKALALLAYLAVEDRPHRRDGLATLLWPELSQAKARNGLRRTLHALKQALGDRWLDVSREMVRLRHTPDLTVDIWQFRALLTPQAGAGATPVAALREAVALYRDDFLVEFSLRDASAFEDWRYFTAEELRWELVCASDVLLQAERDAGDLGAALQTARRRLALDPLEEGAHRTLIELHLAAGDRAAAVRQYEHCAQMLAHELGVEPDAATRALLTSPPSKSIPATPAVLTPPQPAAHGPAELGQAELGQPGEDAIRQIVVLNVAIVGWPDGAQRSSRQEPLGPFLASAAAALARYAAHVDRLGPDGIVAFFGVPYSHEDDAERALHVALGLRAAAYSSGIELAAGVKVGPALVSLRQEHGDVQTQAMFGAVLGQAAEFQRAAAAGQILVDRVTYLHTRNSFSFQPLEVPFRGQPAAAKVYLVLAELHLRKTRGIPELQSRLVGRAAELDILAQAVAGLGSGTGQVVLLTAEAGVGKSRLVAEARARQLPQNLWLEGRCLEMTEAASYGPFLDALRSYFGWQLGDGEAVQTEAMRAGLAHLAGACAWDGETSAEIGAVLGKLFAVRFGARAACRWDDRLANAAPTELRYRTIAAVRTLLRAIAQAQGLILVLEDLHWADDASLDLLNELLPSVCTEPLLLICVYRPVREHRCSQLPVLAARKCPAHYLELRLNELAPAEIDEMVTSLLEIEALAPATKSWILEHAQGNPYFTEEIILALIEAGLIRRNAEVWRTSDPRAGAQADLELPFSVDQLILTRVDRLPAPLRHTLEAAAVLGRTFALPLLQRIAADGSSLAAQMDGQVAGQVAEQIAELERRSFLYCEQAEPVAEYSFRHALLQVAVYQMLPEARRSTLHLQAAQALEWLYADNLDAHVDALAYHYGRTNDLQRAVDYLLKAGAAARATFANGAAVAYFQGALDRLAQLAADGQGGADLTWTAAWHQLGRTYYAMGSYARAEAAFGEAIGHAQTGGAPASAVVRLIYWRGEALYWQGKVAEFVANARAGLALLPAEAPCRETALMLGHLAAGVIELGDAEQYDAYARQLRPLVRTFPFAEELSPAYHQVIDHYKMLGDAPAAMAWIESLHAAATARQDMTSLAKAVMVRGVALSQQGDFTGAAKVLGEALALSRRISETTLIFFCVDRLAINAIVQGKLAAACSYADQLLDLTEPGTSPAAEIRIACGTFYLGAGRIEEALDLLAPTTGEHEETAAFETAESHYYLACALAAAGRADEAVRLYQAVLASSRPDSPPLLSYPEMKPAYWAAVAALDRLGAVPASGCISWCPAAAQPLHDGETGAVHEVRDQMLAQWQWCDPYQDGACHVEQGAELFAADGRDLWYINTGAPSLRTDVAGDFALQARCRPSPLRPLAMGGLLLWCDGANYVRLDWGGLGPGEISCLGWVSGERRFWGRGRSLCARPYLRLERRDDEVQALYSEDGRQWLRVGATTLVAGGQWAAGLLALGMVDRSMYPGAPAGGAAIRFDAVRLWRG